MPTNESGPRPSDGDEPLVEAPIVLDVTGLASSGEGVGRMASGQVVFVDGGVPGDRVELDDVTIRKKLVRARVGRLLEASPNRVEPICRHFETCGGCRWQHIGYAAQLDAKRSIVRDALVRIGGFDSGAIPGGRVEIVGSPEPYGYRARARLVESNGTIGYRERSSHASLAIEECPVLVPEARQALTRLIRTIREAQAESSSGPESQKEAPSPADRPKRRRAAAEWLLTAGSSGPAITQRAGRSGRDAAPREFVTLDILGEKLRAGSGSFLQSNALLWEALAEEVRLQSTLIHAAEGAGSAAPERFVELYCGIGFLTLPLARSGLSGVAVESDRSAVADLACNLASSGLTDRVEVIAGRVETRRDLAKRFETADLLLVDPPRAGLAARVRDAIVSAGPPRIVYVSCDPATLARDLRLFAHAGYALASLRAFDLFPQTPHVEVVVRLERIRKTRASASQV